jgi:adenine-specific DNA methylase
MIDSKNLNRKKLASKKKLGAFYTPQEVTSLLCNWAIRSQNDNILEPSFGGCGFLDASRDRLLSLGCKRPTNHLFGCDIDKEAFEHLSDKIGLAQISKKFILCDFLGLTPSDFSVRLFDVVIGNPPYISHHNMSARQKILAHKAMHSDLFSPNRLASLWAYFVLHSFGFIKQKGRIAWVLPGSFLYADYARDLKQILERKFLRVQVIKLGERIFLSEGAEESTVILLAEGWKEGPATHGIETSFASSVAELENIIGLWSQSDGIGVKLGERANLSYLPKYVREAYQAIVADSDAIKVGNIATILIGIVTGDNRFFVVNEETAKQNQIPTSALKPLLTKFNLTEGLTFKSVEITAARRENIRCLLIDTTGMRKNGKVSKYIANYPTDKQETNATYEKRKVWHQPDDGKIPDAFFPYMNHDGPRIVLNKARIQCTNTIHRLFYNKDVSNLKRKLAAISILSSFSQLSAEIAGRCYGSGALKLEPSEAKNISLLMPANIKESAIDAAMTRIDASLRTGDLDRARCIADELLLINYSKRLSKDLITLFSNALVELRKQRKRSQKSPIKI